MRVKLRSQSSRVAVAVGGCLTLACSGNEEPVRSSSVVRDSAGVTIVENVAPIWEPGQEWRVGRLLSSIGTAEGEPENELFRALGATRLPDGTVAVANTGTSEIRFFDGDGAFLRSSGRLGGGPGEFQATGLRHVSRVDGDSIYAWDLLAQRMSVFAPGGEFVRSNRLRNTNRMYFMDGLFADRSMLLRLIRPNLSDRFVEGYSRDTVRYLRFGVNGDSLGLFGEYPGSETYVARWGEQGMMSMTAPFGKVTSAVAGVDRAYVGTGDSYEISVYSLSAELVMSIRKEHPPVPLSDEAAERWYADREARRSENEGGSEWTDLRDEMVLPDYLPAHGTILVDDSSNLWVREYGDGDAGDAEWSVFNRSGFWLGTVTVPSGLRVFEIGDDYILGREVDDLEVEYVRVYELIKALRP